MRTLLAAWCFILFSSQVADSGTTPMIHHTTDFVESTRAPSTMQYSIADSTTAVTTDIESTRAPSTMAYTRGISTEQTTQSEPQSTMAYTRGPSTIIDDTGLTTEQITQGGRASTIIDDRGLTTEQTTPSGGEGSWTTYSFLSEGSLINNPVCPLPDCAFTATSSFFPCTDAPASRIDGEGAWVADPDDFQPYIEVDLLREVDLYQVVTQGNAHADEWVTFYHLSNSSDGITWTFSGYDEPTIYQANSDADTPVINYVDEYVITSRYFRIHPLGFVGRYALRFDLIGPQDCPGYDLDCPAVAAQNDLEPLIANTKCPVPLCHLSATSYLVPCTTASSAILPLELSACSQTMVPVQSHLLCNTWIQAESDYEAFLEIDLGAPTEVKEVVTQGRGVGYSEWVNSYKVSYSDDGTLWTFSLDSGDAQIFPGNSDSHSLASNAFAEGAVVARYWRVHPVGYVGRPALRLELLGTSTCPVHAPCP